MFLVAVFHLLVFSVFWRIIITNFFHCFFVDGENYFKKSKIEYDDKEIQHDVQLINNGASIQVELGLCVYRNIRRSTF